MRHLLPDGALHRSPVVANRRMNRERHLTGGNGYERDLRLHPLDFLRERVDGPALWIDLCCGTGRALAEAAEVVASTQQRIQIVGIDLVGMFDANPHPELLSLVEASIESYRPRELADLVTCVHGLH